MKRIKSHMISDISLQDGKGYAFVSLDNIQNEYKSSIELFTILNVPKVYVDYWVTFCGLYCEKYEDKVLSIIANLIKRFRDNRGAEN